MTSGPVTAIDVTGAVHLSRDQIVALSGLTTGRQQAIADLDAAMTRLLDTGLVLAAHYHLQPAAGGMRLALDVVEPLWTMAVLLDNFIWFSDQEIYETVAREIPTFDGAVPDTDGSIKTVARVLQGMLDAHQIPGHVDYQRYMQLDGERDVGRAKERFRVTGVPMPVCAVRFANATRANEIALVKASSFLTGGQYSREQLFKVIEGDLTPIYKQGGYLQALFRAPDVERHTGADCSGGVDVAIAVEEGPVFNVGRVEWTGNQAMTSKALDAAVGVKPGERADTVKFGVGLSAVKTLYEHAGHLDFLGTPTLSLDPAGHFVTYRVEIREGEVYRMGALQVVGFRDNDAKALTRAWSMRFGVSFDLPVGKAFPIRVALQGIVRSRVFVDIKPSPETHFVDVTIRAK